MGAITEALRAACVDLGVTIRTSPPVADVNVAGGRAQGVTLEDGSVVDAKIVVSNADPKRTCLGLIDPAELAPEFRRDVANIRMDGPAGTC